MFPQVCLPCLHSSARPVHFAQIFLGSGVSLARHQQICRAGGQMALTREQSRQALDRHTGRVPPVAPSPSPRGLTCHSRGRLDILPIKVGDDGFTLLCGLHPKKHMRGKALPVRGIHVFHTHSVRRTQVPSPMHAPEALCGTHVEFLSHVFISRQLHFLFVCFVFQTECVDAPGWPRIL